MKNIENIQDEINCICDEHEISEDLILETAALILRKNEIVKIKNHFKYPLSMFLTISELKDIMGNDFNNYNVDINNKRSEVKLYNGEITIKTEKTRLNKVYDIIYKYCPEYKDMSSCDIHINHKNVFQIMEEIDKIEGVCQFYDEDRQTDLFICIDGIYGTQSLERKSLNDCGYTFHIEY